MRLSVVLSVIFLAITGPSLALPVSRGPPLPEWEQTPEYKPVVWRREDAPYSTSSDDLESGASRIGKVATVAGIGTSLAFGGMMLKDLLTPTHSVVYVGPDGQPIQNQRRSIEDPPSHNVDAQDGESGAIGLADASSLAGMATSAYFLMPMLKQMFHHDKTNARREYVELVARAPPPAHAEPVHVEAHAEPAAPKMGKLEKVSHFSSLGMGAIAVLSMIKSAMSGNSQ